MVGDLFSEDDLDPFKTKKKSGQSRDKRRSFLKSQKNEIWVKQKGKCAKCKKTLDPRTVEYDHKKSFASGGKTTVSNGQALCSECHKKKSHKQRLAKYNKSNNSNSYKSKKRKNSNNPLDMGISEKDLNPFGS